MDSKRTGERTQPGHAHHKNLGWTLTPNNSKHPGLMGAIEFFAENELHLNNVISARVA